MRNERVLQRVQKKRNIVQTIKGLTELVTSYVGTAFQNKLKKERRVRKARKKT